MAQFFEQVLLKDKSLTYISLKKIIKNFVFSLVYNAVLQEIFYDPSRPQGPGIQGERHTKRIMYIGGPEDNVHWRTKG